jgi:hypothetical protein
MPYASGETPVIGDYVRHAQSGAKGEVTHVRADPISPSPREQITVEWDDADAAEEEVVSPANEFVLVSRAREVAS